MQPLPRSGEDRTCLVGLVTYGDHVVESLPDIPVQGLRLLPREVYPYLIHRSYGQLPDVRCLGTGAEYLKAVASKVAQQTLRHLRAGGVMSAQEEHPGPPPRYLSSSHRPTALSRVQALAPPEQENCDQEGKESSQRHPFHYFMGHAS